MADCKENKEETNRPSYILKVDPPQESPGESPENSTSEMESPPAENNTQESPSSSTKPVLAAPKFGTSFGSSNTSKSLVKNRSSFTLRHSQLNAVTNNPPTTKMYLQPAKFQNPCTKVTDNFLEEKNELIKENNKTETKKDKIEEKEDKSEKENDNSEVEETKSEIKESKSEEKPNEEVKPTFLMLGESTKDNVNITVTPCASEPNFVFGQNLQERVMIANDAESSEKAEGEKKEEKKEESTNENGSTELLFSNASAACRTTSKPGLTLTEAAQELEEANRANKRKYSQVTPLTGEEGETNVLQINCKFFAFDKASGGWQERGRGTLRLNDRDEESRLVGRTAGTQRLIMNTKIWPGMTAERAAPKSLRLTAMEVQGSIRIFIIQAAPKHVEQLHNLLQQRLKRAQERQPKKLAFSRQSDH
ncbi:PREDICTED: ran-binding protein 3 isoform X2 [Eufriesea mexicana]|uniref:ran-binding protein 3 isoform X2 n=1 Tax=Eufriesea mexicana TaxID=516756 RepID=UPI00083C3B69|nr:PREDICTED: ran-binding protein 3 isoform X2 [Eufriesea mexicana]